MINTCKSRLSKSDFMLLVKCFSYDVDATKTSKIVGLNRNTVNKYFNEIRLKIYTYYNKDYYLNDTVCEIDESWFGPSRAKGRNGKSHLGKIIFFGIVERNGDVYTEIVENIKTFTLYKIIKERINTNCVVYSDECNSYNYLKDKRYKHETVCHSKNNFVRGDVNTNSIESYWSFENED